ncbi:2-oxo-4-hydroxy-4-carboxy-5-ureidoimidazoline decarboxylase [Paenibacillus sp. PK4536]|uniref:2-oxo-4-hydroxy-4-carboxy-5-ureidoimidazoline decarboxylase n=1 Tax=Paenibacillus sp. PK4536 TaxID=3024576 RepID=UPI002358DBC2|nr:2-oxo-4-hydroxy-4-carboxy-5-ureidoimidazoline decarboxylase [Paenibacillus sp. PK4536]WIM37707.1 2-oxo-4-hydroxy-4-carboxy-5-ureidoimidazoline decarboxylase [Paenibacillus sp. PK4536]
MEMTQKPWQLWSKEEFLQQFGGLYEHSAWITEQAWEHQPFNTLQDMLNTMKNIVAESSQETQLTLLRQHPDLGTKIEMSEHSQSEQAGAGLTGLSAEQFEQLAELNRNYTDQYQFPFILAVKGKSTDQILESMRQRTGRSATEEFQTALGQVHTIAGLRLQMWAEERNLYRKQVE